MIVFLAALGLLCLYQISCPLLPGRKPADGAPYYPDFCSVDKTNAIKGVFIILVLFNHLLRYYLLTESILDRSFELILSAVGQSVVAPFLFYSGYGILFSIRSKGQPYIDSLLKKRFPTVLLHFNIAVLLFVFVNLLLHNSMTVPQILLSLICWDSVGNSNWYIFDVLCLYLITYIAFSIFRRKHLYGILCTFVLSAGVMLLLGQFKEVWWYDTLPCYSLGMLWCYGSGSAEKWLFGKRYRYSLTLAVLAAATVLFTLFCKGVFPTMIRHLLFMATFVLLTMKVSVCNKVLCFFGRHLFSIYILQRIPMMVLDHWGVRNPYLLTVLTLGATVALAVPFDLLLARLDGVLFRKKQPASSV